MTYNSSDESSDIDQHLNLNSKKRYPERKNISSDSDDHFMKKRKKAPPSLKEEKKSQKKKAPKLD